MFQDLQSEHSLFLGAAKEEFAQLLLARLSVNVWVTIVTSKWHPVHFWLPSSCTAIIGAEDGEKQSLEIVKGCELQTQEVHQ